jgi:hypothetical protein
MPKMHRAWGMEHGAKKMWDVGLRGGTGHKAQGSRKDDRGQKVTRH